MDPDTRTRAAIEGHWQASERGDTEAEHAIYAADAVLDYPQSGERFRSRATISAQRGGHPASRHFTVLRITGGGDRWVLTEIMTIAVEKGVLGEIPGSQTTGPHDPKVLPLQVLVQNAPAATVVCG